MGNALAPIMGLLAGLVEFITSTVLVVFHALGFVLERIGTIGKRVFEQIGSSAVWMATTAKNAVKAMTPGSGYTFEDMKRDQEVLDKETAEGDAQDDKEYREKTDKNMADSALAFARAADGVRSGMSTMYENGKQIAINTGLKKNRLDTANDDEIDDQKSIEHNKSLIAVAESALKDAKAKKEKLIEEGANEREVFRAGREVERARAFQKGVHGELRRLDEAHKKRLLYIQEYYPKAVFEDNKFKEKTDRKAETPATLKTLKQTEIELSQDKLIREQAVKSVEANIDSWDKWKQGVYVAQLQYQNAQADYIAFMASGESQNIAKKNAFLNAQTNAHINLQAKEKELQNLKDIAARDAALADIDRKNKAIEGQQGRDLFGMKMRGVSAIDQQNVVFRNAVDKMKREEAKLEALAKDPMREKEYMGGKGPAAIALKNSIQDLMMSAAGEMDTLMAMQFNYVSSDAAKKGMGGGISMVNNPIDIAKESRDYLRKIYESMEGTGSFNVVPKYSPDGNPRGPMGSSLWGEAPSSQ